MWSCPLLHVKEFLIQPSNKFADANILLFLTLPMRFFDPDESFYNFVIIYGKLIKNPLCRLIKELAEENMSLTRHLGQPPICNWQLAEGACPATDPQRTRKWAQVSMGLIPASDDGVPS